MRINNLSFGMNREFGKKNIISFVIKLKKVNRINYNFIRFKVV